MVAAIRLTVLTGPHQNRRFCFCGPMRCLAGRALDCFVQLTGTERDKLISRHHCRLDIDPPCMQVQDLGSTNGTYINGKKVDGVDLSALSNPEACRSVVNHGDVLTLKKVDGSDLSALSNSDICHSVVNDGDLLTLGGTTLRVDFLDCPHADKAQDCKPVWEHGETAKKDCQLQC